MTRNWFGERRLDEHCSAFVTHTAMQQTRPPPLIPVRQSSSVTPLISAFCICGQVISLPPVFPVAGPSPHSFPARS